jgi:hypothetical protein
MKLRKLPEPVVIRFVELRTRFGSGQPEQWKCQCQNPVQAEDAACVSTTG